MTLSVISAQMRQHQSLLQLALLIICTLLSIKLISGLLNQQQLLQNKLQQANAIEQTLSNKQRSQTLQGQLTNEQLVASLLSHAQQQQLNLVQENPEKLTFNFQQAAPLTLFNWLISNAQLPSLQIEQLELSRSLLDGKLQTALVSGQISYRYQQGEAQ